MTNELQTFNLSDRVLYINDDIDNVTSCDTVKFCNNLIIKDNKIIKENTKILEDTFNQKLKEKITPPDVNVYLNTFGGACYDGWAIHDMLRNLNNHCKVNIYAVGACLSAGTFILLSVPYEQRFAYKNTTFMIHTVSSIAVGKVAELEDSVKEAKRLNDMIFDLFMKETAITKADLDDIYDKKKDWVITADEALKLKLISKVI